MKLKGHATIELTDVNTGEKVVHEDDNMITNAIKNLLGFMGASAFDGSYSLNYSLSTHYSPLKRLTGGLLLFDSVIEENPETVFASKGVGLVGCGSGISYNGENVMAGSYNKTESGKIDGGYKHVWDFGTSQANGQIACACLTSMAGGKVTPGSFPYASDYIYKSGDSIDTVDENFFSSYRTQIFISKCKEEGYPSSSSGAAILFVDGKRNRILKATSAFYNKTYYSNSTTEQERFQESIFYKRAIEFQIIRLGVTNFSIFDSPSTQAYMKSAAYDEFATETVTVEMPTGLKKLITDDMINNYNRYFGASMSSDENYIYIAIKLATTSTNDVIEPNGKFYVWKINAETFESTYFEVTNTTNEQIYFVSGSESKGGMNICGHTDLCVFDDVLFCYGYSSKKVYSINLNDNTDVSEIKYPDGSNFVITNTTFGFGFAFYQQGKIILGLNGFGSSTYLYVVDPTLKQATFKNAPSGIFYPGYSSYGNDATRKVLPVAGTMFLASVYTTGNYCSLCFFVDPAFLVTINNLSSPVLKTASQTMKVTYTLTQVAEEAT